MTIDRIRRDYIYQHEKYGTVLVTGIGKMYDEWSISGPKNDIESGDVLIYFYDDYDGYGGMNPMPLSETADEFAKSVTDEVEEHEYVEWED